MKRVQTPFTILILVGLSFVASVLSACATTPQPAPKPVDNCYSTSKLERAYGTIFDHKGSIWLASKDGSTLLRLIKVEGYQKYTNVTANDSNLCFTATEAQTGKNKLFTANFDGSGVSERATLGLLSPICEVRQKVIGNYIYYAMKSPSSHDNGNHNAWDSGTADTIRRCGYRLPLDSTTGEYEILYDEEITKEEGEVNPRPFPCNEILGNGNIYCFENSATQFILWRLSPDLKTQTKIIDASIACTLDAEGGVKDRYIYGTSDYNLMSVNFNTGEQSFIRKLDSKFERGGLRVYSDIIVGSNDSKSIREFYDIEPEYRGTYFYDINMNQLAFCKTDESIGFVRPIVNTKDAIIFSDIRKTDSEKFYYIQKSDLRANKVVTMSEVKITNFGE